MPIHKRWRFALRLALCGFLVNAAIFAYLELANYPPLGLIPVILCPASVMGAFLFFDLNAHTALMAVAWVFQGLVNAAIYFGIGSVIGRLLWKSD
jgi:hypothetical protein